MPSVTSGEELKFRGADSCAGTKREVGGGLR